jgi:hypothetical protein
MAKNKETTIDELAIIMQEAQQGRGQSDATVVYDGRSLTFPDSVKTEEPLHQARRQAIWLSTWLTSAIAEPVAVKPVLALPGWYIERTTWGDVLLLNGKDYRFLVSQRTGTALSDALIQRISHQLEQRCRDVEPKAHNIARKGTARSQRNVA